MRVVNTLHALSMDDRSGMGTKMILCTTGKTGIWIMQ